MKKTCFIITNPMIAENQSTKVTLSKFTRVISAVYDEIIILGGNLSVENDLTDVQLRSWKIHRAANKAKRMLDIAVLQFKMAADVLRRIRRDTPVYFWVGDKMLLPYWAAKIKGADVRYFIYGNVYKEGIRGSLAKLSGALITYMANHAASVCVESKGVLQEWESRIRPKALREVHLYTDTATKQATRDPQPVVGMLCRLTEGKHVVESIEACVAFHEEYPEFRLEIIGSGRQETVCRDLVKQLSAERYIQMHGWIDHTCIAEKTREWKYLLFPSDTEGMPNSVLEMMGTGVPAVASPVGGLRDIIVPGKTGWLITAPTKDEILRALKAAVQDENYACVAEAAQHLVTENYSLQAAQKNACRDC